MLTEAEIYHELGHALIAIIFNGEYYTFEGIILKPETKYNAMDKAYTLTLPFSDSNTFIEKINQDVHMASCIDGMILLGGVAGLTIHTNPKGIEKSSKDNYRAIYNLEGSEGDFEIINKASRPYGWFLKNVLEDNNDEIDNLNSEILNILFDLFFKPEFTSVFHELKNICTVNDLVTFDSIRNIVSKLDLKKEKNELLEIIKSGRLGSKKSKTQFHLNHTFTEADILKNKLK